MLQAGLCLLITLPTRRALALSGLAPGGTLIYLRAPDSFPSLDLFFSLLNTPIASR